MGRTATEAAARRWRRRRPGPAAALLLAALSPADASRLDRRTPDVRRLQGGGLSFGSVGSTDSLGSCYADLVESDADGDGYVSPSEYVTFVQAMADGALDSAPWGTPISTYLDLSMSYPQFVRIYNRFACGDANVGCPAVPGIDVSGLDEVVNGNAKAEDAVDNEAGLILLCAAVEDEADKLAPPPAPATPAPVPTTDDPTGAPGPSTDGPTGAPAAAPWTYLPTASPYPTPAVWPTYSPIAPPPAPATPAPVPGGPPSCPPEYERDAEYSAGDEVINPPGLSAPAGKAVVYRCRGFPFEDWCDQVGYEPGVDLNYAQAWEAVGSCVIEGGGSETGGDGGKTASPTASPGSGAPTKAGGLASLPPASDLTSSPTTAEEGGSVPSTDPPTAYPVPTYRPTDFDEGELPVPEVPLPPVPAPEIPLPETGSPTPAPTHARTPAPITTESPTLAPVPRPSTAAPVTSVPVSPPDPGGGAFPSNLTCFI